MFVNVEADLEPVKPLRIDRTITCVLGDDNALHSFTFARIYIITRDK